MYEKEELRQVCTEILLEMAEQKCPVKPMEVDGRNIRCAKAVEPEPAVVHRGRLNDVVESVIRRVDPAYRSEDGGARWRR